VNVSLIEAMGKQAVEGSDPFFGGEVIGGGFFFLEREREIERVQHRTLE
jgi:hypothetical protein